MDTTTARQYISQASRMTDSELAAALDQCIEAMSNGKRYGQWVAAAALALTDEGINRA